MCELKIAESFEVLCIYEQGRERKDNLKDVRLTNLKCNVTWLAKLDFNRQRLRICLCQF